MKTLIIAAIMLLAACSKTETSTADAPPDASVPADSKFTLTAQDLDGFQKGLTEEVRLVQEGKERAAKATTPTERGNAIQSTFEENTIRSAIPKSGLTLERYHAVRDVMARLLTTLDFQDKIPGPQSVDTALADSAMKARLRSDPYAELDAPSAELVKGRLDGIAPIWIEDVKLTVTGGGIA
jgi:hypothetical protein